MSTLRVVSNGQEVASNPGVASSRQPGKSSNRPRLTPRAKWFLWAYLACCLGWALGLTANWWDPWTQ